MKTHPKVGDLAIVKMFETGYKRTGERVEREASGTELPTKGTPWQE